jgi:Zn-dependent M28 family amino/carboxypeptidase
MNTQTAHDNEAIANALRQHVYKLADDIGERNIYLPQALHAAERYIRQTWQTMGYDVHLQEYEVNGVRSANLEIEIAGSSKAKEILLVGAHYDSVRGSPGANDNGSGVASLLELSRLFIASLLPQRTIRFVAFVNEEPPFFLTSNMGSMHYAKAARRKGDDIRLMLSLETIGYYRDEPGSQGYPPLFRYFYPDSGNFIAFVSNLRSRPQLKQLTTAFRHCSDFPVEQVSTFSWIPGVGWSDHFSFWLRRYHAVMVTDTAFYRYPYYHSYQDTAEKLDYARLADVTAGLYGALTQVDGYR